MSKPWWVIPKVGCEINAGEFVLRRTAETDDHIPQVVHGDSRVEIPASRRLVNSADLPKGFVEDIHFIPSDNSLVLQTDRVSRPDRTVLVDSVEEAEIILIKRGHIGRRGRGLIKPCRDGDIGDMLKGRVS